MSSERHLRTIKRWAWSQLEETPNQKWQPVAREYCVDIWAMHFDCGESGGYALCDCEMLPDHYEAALQDHRLTILDDLYSQAAIPEGVAVALGPRFKLSLKDTVRQMLVKLSKHHLRFLPEQ